MSERLAMVPETIREPCGLCFLAQGRTCPDCGGTGYIEHVRQSARYRRRAWNRGAGRLFRSFFATLTIFY